MRLAIIGAGNVGSALGTSWSRKGHAVLYGVPDPKAGKYATLGKDRVTTPVAAAKQAEAIVLATPWDATEAACRSLGTTAGKIVIDCTNPLRRGSEGPELALGFSTSGGEMVQSWCPDAHVFKALNQVGFEIMRDPSQLPRPPVMLAAGNDSARKLMVLALISDLGFDAVDAGPLRNARLLEPFAMLWIDLAYRRGVTRLSAFSLLRPKM